MFEIINKIGPYNGKFCNNIVTYKLKNISDNKIYAWHSGPNKIIDFEVGDILIDIYLINEKINYKKSNPKKNQLELF